MTKRPKRWFNSNWKRMIPRNIMTLSRESELVVLLKYSKSKENQMIKYVLLSLLSQKIMQNEKSYSTKLVLCCCVKKMTWYYAALNALTLRVDFGFSWRWWTEVLLHQCWRSWVASIRRIFVDMYVTVFFKDLSTYMIDIFCTEI